MLTETQLDTLIAINDHIDVHGDLALGPDDVLPEILTDLNMPDTQLHQAIADLHELGHIRGIMANEFDWPVLVTSVTASGRQELPSG